MRVFAKAYGGRPLDRVVTGSSEKLIYLVNPSAVDAIGITPFSGVGFPKDAVFQFDSALFESLGAAWDKGAREEVEALWGEAEPLHEAMAA